MIELRVLGPISLKRADGSTVGSVIAQPKRLALAAYLAAPPPHGGRCFHRKDSLIGLFWPELDQQRARASLRNALYFLRSALGAGAVLNGTDDSVGLDPGEVWCDLDAFDVAVRIRDGVTAYQLYRGSVLEGVHVHEAQPFEEWLDTQRRRRAAEVQEVTAQAARRHAAAGRLDDALVWARRAREMAPLNEDAVRLLISLRFLAGDRAGALVEYRQLEQLLDEEHGMPPSRMTRQLIEAIRAPQTDPETVARTIEQLPLPPGAKPASVTLMHTSATPYAREVLAACLQLRMGLARRRGEQVGVILLRCPPQRSKAAVARDAAALAQCVHAVLRSADLVAQLDPHTLAILPSEDGGIDLNAFVGRLTQAVAKAVESTGETAAVPVPAVESRWLDPSRGVAASDLLAELAA
jgi:DNA-binding SARP family transcriptional activator